MDKNAWSKIKDIFDHICDEGPTFRRNYLDMVCADEASLRREIEAMLVAHDNMPSKFNKPIVDTDIPIPARIGSYEIHELIGSGGMSKVCRASHPRYGDVAVKIVPQHLFSHPDTQLRFRQEAEILRSLSHRSLCEIHELLQTDNIAAIAMQLLDGDTLDVVLSKTSVPIDQAIKIVVDIADLLVLAHENGIVHRDIKPSNVMLDPAGNTTVIDFGIAKQLDAKLTRTGQLLGSPKYMSPEQWRGDAVDFRTDIWSLGMLLYELCTGELPFQGDDHATIAKVVLSDKAILSTGGKSKRITPPSLHHLVEQMLQKNPDSRQASMAEVRDALIGVILD